MEISPIDIRNQSFKKKTFGGYDPDEVHAFLAQVAAQVESLVKKGTETNEKLKISEERVNYYKLIEKTLQDSVVTMQKTVDEKRSNANKEAELIIAEAKANATKETELIRNQANEMRVEIEALRTQKENYFIRIRSLIKSQDQLLNAMEKDFVDVSENNNISQSSMMFRKKKLQQEKQENMQKAKKHLQETGAHPIVNSDGVQIHSSKVQQNSN